MEIYVGGLDYSMEEKDLEELFAPFGKTSRIMIIRDRVSQRSRGFGFVRMDNSDEAEKAIGGLNGLTVRGRTLKVNQSQSSGIF